MTDIAALVEPYQHDWECIWFGYHVQYQCRQCGTLKNMIYEHGVPLEPLPPPYCVKAPVRFS